MKTLQGPPASNGKIGVTPGLPTTTLTRCDWNGNFDSLKWALEVHVKRQDTGEFNFACLYGNEDSPERIDFYKSANPHWNEYIALTWFPPMSKEGDYTHLREMDKTVSGWADLLDNSVRRRVSDETSQYINKAVQALTEASINLNAAANQIARES